MGEQKKKRRESHRKEMEEFGDGGRWKERREGVKVIRILLD